MINLTLPFPPSLNTYWRHVGHKVLLSAKGRQYRKDVAAAVLSQGVARVEGRLAVNIMAFPPDRRVRDLDNLLKGLLDALQHAGVYEDDGLIDKLTIERMFPFTDGFVTVMITPRPDV